MKCCPYSLKIYITMLVMKEKMLHRKVNFSDNWKHRIDGKIYYFGVKYDSDDFPLSFVPTGSEERT